LLLVLVLVTGCEVLFPLSGGDVGDDEGDDGEPMLDAQLPPRCLERPGVFFCDGFEDTPGPWSYVATGAGASVARTAEARTGASGITAIIATSGDTADVRVLTLGGLTTGDLYVRAWFMIRETSTNPIDHADLLKVSGTVEGVSVFVRQNELQVWNAMTTQGLGALTNAPRGQWFCLELHIAIDPTMGQLELFMDDQQLIQSALTETATTGGFGRLQVGIPHSEDAQGLLELAADDVSVGTARIGCS
jgi:hypothetical protein